MREGAHELVLGAGESGLKAQVWPSYVEVWHQGQWAARHERCRQLVLDLEHYLDVLERRPGALAGSTPLAQCGKLGRWPASYDQLWASLVERHGGNTGDVSTATPRLERAPVGGFLDNMRSSRF